MFKAFCSGVKKRIYKGIPVSEVPKLEGEEVALVRLNLGIAWGKLGTALALYSSSPFSSVQKVRDYFLSLAE